MSQTYEAPIPPNHHLIRKHLMGEFESVISFHNAVTISEENNQKCFVMQVKLKDGETQQIYSSLKFHDEFVWLELWVKVKPERFSSNPYATMNNTSTNNNLGTFYIQESNIFKAQDKFTNQILFQLNLAEISTYMKKKLENNIIQFIDLLEKLYHENKKPIKTSKRKQILAKVTQARQAIEIQISERPDSTLQYPKYSQLTNIQTLNLKVQQNQNDELKNKMKFHELLLIHKKQKTQKSEDKKSGPRIVRQLQIRKIFDISNLREQTSNAAFSIIKKIQGEFKIENLSINQDANELIQAEDNYQDDKEECIINTPLVQKTAKEDQNAIQSIQTEFAVLKYLRNFHSNIIASYYLKKKKKNSPIAPIKIYSDFYEHNLHSLLFQRQNSLQFQDRLRILIYLANVLRFLHKIEVSHRDLKPYNIMLNNNRVPKLIDFGSAWIRNSIEEQGIKKSLKTSEDYNLIYNSAPLMEYRDRITREQFECHEYFDIYFYGNLVKKILEVSNPCFYHANILKPHLDWIVHQCRRPFPYDRISPEQLAFIISHIWKLYASLNTSKSC